MIQRRWICARVPYLTNNTRFTFRIRDYIKFYGHTHKRHYKRIQVNFIVIPCGRIIDAFFICPTVTYGVYNQLAGHYRTASDQQLWYVEMWLTKALVQQLTTCLEVLDVIDYWVTIPGILPQLYMYQTVSTLQKIDHPYSACKRDWCWCVISSVGGGYWEAWWCWPGK